MQRISLLLIIFFLSVSAVYAQSNAGFSNDPAVFIKEASQLLTDTKRDDCQQTAKDLQVAWQAFGPSQQADIIAIATTMKERKMLVTPYFQKFFAAAAAFKTSGQNDDFFDNWQEVTTEVISTQRQGNYKKYEDYLDFSFAFLTRRAFFISEGRRWKFDGDVYELGMVSN